MLAARSRKNRRMTIVWKSSWKRFDIFAPFSSPQRPFHLLVQPGLRLEGEQAGRYDSGHIEVRRQCHSFV